MITLKYGVPYWIEPPKSMAEIVAKQAAKLMEGK